MLFFVRVDFILSHELEIFFWEDEIFQRLFEVNGILTPFRKEEISRSITREYVSDMRSGDSGIEREKCAVTPYVIHERSDDLHAYRSDEDIIIHRQRAKFFPEFLMTELFQSAELTHVADKGDRLAGFSTSQAHEHLHTCDDRVESSVISAVYHETLVQSLEDVSSGEGQMDMAQEGNRVQRRNSTLHGSEEGASQESHVVGSKDWGNDMVRARLVGEIHLETIRMFRNIADDQIAHLLIFPIPYLTGEIRLVRIVGIGYGVGVLFRASKDLLFLAVIELFRSESFGMGGREAREEDDIRFHDIHLRIHLACMVHAVFEHEDMRITRMDDRPEGQKRHANPSSYMHPSASDTQDGEGQPPFSIIVPLGRPDIPSGSAEYLHDDMAGRRLAK